MGAIESITSRLRGRKIDTSQVTGGGLMRLGGSRYDTSWNYGRVMTSVFSNPTAFACIQYRVRHFSRPAWALTNPKSDDPVETHPLLTLLNEPAPGVTGTDMQQLIQTDLCLTGRSTWLKARGGMGEQTNGPVTNLQRLPSSRVVPVGNDDDVLLGFIYSDNTGARVPLTPDEVVYVRYMNPERTYDSIAPAQIAGLSTETDTAAQRFNFELLANDAALPGYIALEDVSTAEFAEWVERWKSGEVPGKTRFMRGKASYMKVGQTNKELAYDTLRHMSQEDTCRAFSTPSVLIDPTESTFANMEEAIGMFLRGVMWFDWTLVGDAFTNQLGREFGMKVGFDLDDVPELTEGEDALITRQIQLLDADAITINEVRGEIGLDPVPWGDVPLSQLRQVMAPPVAPDPIPPEVEPGLADGVAEPDNEQIGKAILKALPTPLVKSAPSPWEAFNRAVEAYEGRTQRKIHKFFTRQGKAVASAVRANARKSYAKAVDPHSWWNGERWDNELQDETSAYLEDTVDAFGTATATQLGGAAFDSRADRVQEYLSTRSETISGLVNGTTEQDIRSRIADGEANGLSIDEIANSIETYFEDQAGMRAERVARTEVIGAANWAASEGAKQSGVVTSKIWLAAGDGADEECADNDGSSFDLDDDSIPAHPNCRCCWIFQTDSGDEMPPTDDDSGE